MRNRVLFVFAMCRMGVECCRVSHDQRSFDIVLTFTPATGLSHCALAATRVVVGMAPYFCLASPTQDLNASSFTTRTAIGMKA